MINVLEESDSDRSVSGNYSQQDSASSHHQSVSESNVSGMRPHDEEDEEDFLNRMSKQVKKQFVSPSKNKTKLIADQTHDFIILGLVSSNKELFLFDRHVSMSRPID